MIYLNITNMLYLNITNMLSIEILLINVSGLLV